MKKNILIFISILILIGGGCIYMYFYEKQQEREKYFAKQEQRVEIFLKYNIPTYKTVTFTKKDVTPMGIPYLDGYINNDKKLTFSASVQPNNHNFEGLMGMTSNLDRLFKEDTKTYSEIMKEKQSKRK